MRKYHGDMGESDMVLIPLNVGGRHWTLAVIHFRLQQFQYYDSLGSSWNKCYYEALRSFVVDYFRIERNECIDVSTWRKVSGSMPRQKNGCDCGVFLCIGAAYLSGNYALDWSQAHMVHFRMLMTLELLENKILDPYSSASGRAGGRNRAREFARFQADYVENHNDASRCTMLPDRADQSNGSIRLNFVMRQGRGERGDVKFGSTLCSLPQDLLLVVMQTISLEELVNVRRVSRRFDEDFGRDVMALRGQTTHTLRAGVSIRIT